MVIKYESEHIFDTCFSYKGISLLFVSETFVSLIMKVTAVSVNFAVMIHTTCNHVHVDVRSFITAYFKPSSVHACCRSADMMFPILVT